MFTGNPIADNSPAASAQRTCDAMNANANLKYRDDLAKYNQAVKDWMTNAIQYQADHQPVPSPPAIPVKTVWSVDPNTLQLLANIWQDPAIITPSVPTLVQAVSTPITTGAPANTDMQNALLVEIYNLSQRIATKLGV